MLGSKSLSLSLVFVYFLARVQTEFQVPHLGDFIELHTALRYCKTLATKEINEFTTCTNAAVNPNTMSSAGDLWTRICSNSADNLECWKPIIEKSKSCNAGTSRGPPSIYKGSLEAICGNDKGVSNAAAFTKARDEITTQECSASGDHWEVACKSLENDMSSNDTCTRHRALSNCLDLIICKEQPAGKFYLDLYKAAGSKLGC